MHAYKKNTPIALPDKYDKRKRKPPNAKKLTPDTEILAGGVSPEKRGDVQIL